MKAKPVKLIYGEGYVPATIEEATHITLNFPGPTGMLTLPVIRSGTRQGTGCWSWNGDVDKPTLRPSVGHSGTEQITDEEHAILMAGGHIEPRQFRCHTWVNDGRAQFLDDTTHWLRGQTVDMLDVDP